eukprot:gnl/Chilomastix_caulleri/3939.p2 GENE.gnl/Chilomastix_caulleri/3939~~gnl/Chilomastix_caulleri/3939.p2  ORF type:complete len:78 (+),score=17.91 gnl/Chilomastix_caulleri/3939:276-509(+)
MFRTLKAKGLDAIECYHTDHTPMNVEDLLKIAKENVLGISGGSDYHGVAGHKATLGLADRDNSQRLSAEVAWRLLGK